jgi:3-hydroxy-9,10-secoandrosta-1,3,5(10)-triene-9,17-dione monooxygenase reductase component
MENPFATPSDKRTPARRLRGRLAAPVTIWTAGAPEQRTGLTMSSVLFAEGEPSFVIGLLNDTTDLWDAIEATGKFVVHLLPEGERVLAERFAGQRPSPGGLFVDLDVDTTEYGPLLKAFPNRVFCSFTDVRESGYQQIVRGEIRQIELGELEDPLLHFRGNYRSLAPPR